VTEPLARVVLMIVSGLPGAGKSYFSRRMAERAPLAIVETDAMRNVLFPFPTHSGAENGRLFKACHTLIEDMLSSGISVLFDATNLVEHNRKPLYNIADKTDAKLIIVRVEAPSEVVSERLRKREAGD
jgi:predicted kinase